MKVYPYVDMTRANSDGSFPVYLIVSTRQGRFFVNTGITTCGRLVNMAFPKQDRLWKQKTVLLGTYFASVESLCLSKEIAGLSNAELKALIQREVFGVEKKPKVITLTDTIRAFAATKREHTRQIYELTAKKVDDYLGGKTAKHTTLNDVDAGWLDAFKRHYLDEGMAVNGVGKELRNIRAVFNWARRKGMTNNYPFLDYHIQEEETIPNNLSVEDLRRLRDYPCETWQKPYVDFFFLSFYLAGINPVDLLTLKADAITDGHLSFVRKKTNKEGTSKIRTITLPVVPEAQEIINRYPSKEGWLLGFMDCRNDYRSFCRVCNEALQKVGPTRKVKDKAGKLRKIEYSPVCKKITLYSARYSFGSIAANELDISERTIGMCLGHSWSANVTARYMATDQRKIDDAVRRVVGLVVDPAEKPQGT